MVNVLINNTIGGDTFMAVTDSVVNRDRVVLQSLASVDYGSHTHVTATCVVTAAVDHLSTSLVDVEAWLKASLVRLNPAKTQFVWLGSQQLLMRLDMATVPILSPSVRIQEMAHDLGVATDSRLSSDHVAAVCRSSYYQLRQLWPVVQCSSEDAANTMVRAFVISYLDYCNALCYGITDLLT